MLNHFSRYLVRHDPRGHWHHHLKSTAGAVIGVGLVGGLAAWSGLPLLMAPMGPTALALAAHPESSSAQPINVFGGYFIAAAFASASELALPGLWWGAALAVGVVMLVMLLARVNHPPAAAVPLAVYASPMAPHLLFGVMLAGCICLVAVMTLLHRIPPRVRYPRWLDDTAD